MRGTRRVSYAMVLPIGTRLGPYEILSATWRGWDGRGFIGPAIPASNPYSLLRFLPSIWPVRPESARNRPGLGRDYASQRRLSGACDHADMLLFRLPVKPYAPQDHLH
jgi:hypothetical protein